MTAWIIVGYGENENYWEGEEPGRAPRVAQREVSRATSRP
jgi:hypothetical protein